MQTLIQSDEGRHIPSQHESEQFRTQGEAILLDLSNLRVKLTGFQGDLSKSFTDKLDILLEFIRAGVIWHSKLNEIEEWLSAVPGKAFSKNPLRSFRKELEKVLHWKHCFHNAVPGRSMTEENVFLYSPEKGFCLDLWSWKKMEGKSEYVEVTGRVRDFILKHTDQILMLVGKLEGVVRSQVAEA